jgi:hypothetical protein
MIRFISAALELKSGVLLMCLYIFLQSRHPLLEESLKQYFGDNTTSAHLKMADVPGEDTTRLIPCTSDGGSPGPFPLVAVRNVFVLPGTGLCGRGCGQGFWSGFVGRAGSGRMLERLARLWY